MSVIQSGTTIFTYSDAVQYVLDAHAVDSTSLNRRHARAAVLKAYRDLPSRHDWTYFYRQRLLHTVASYTTGTVVFDFTGGTNERMLTLTTGTWPSWATFGRVIIDGTHYEVEDRKSNSIITLTETSNPGQDVASTTFTIYRNSYPLPADFKEFSDDGVWDISGNYALNFVDQREQHNALVAFYNTPSTPTHATVRATGKYLGGLELILGPPPNDDLTYDLLYQARPRPLAIEEYCNGTVTVTASDETVTGVAAVFPPNCAGAIIRLSSGTAKPSGSLGSVDGVDNPPVLQAVIESRTDDTHLELTDVADTTYSTGVGYTISDPLDIEPGAMLTALLHAAEAEFSRLAGRQDANAKYALANRSLLEGMEADSHVRNTGRAPYNRQLGLLRATVTND